MEKYVSLVKQRLDSFSSWKLEHIPRDCNEKVEALATVAAYLSMIETVFLPIYYQSDSSIITTRVRLISYWPSCGPYLIHGPARLVFKWKENVKRKCGLIFEFWKIRPRGGTVLLWIRHFYFYF